ncbi:MAG TPA: hypothetical protein P5080_05355 [Candidatus Paceibacterota bacterium]|nr:hypothetical protein [Candidatus Pacearchaeota archaeon]HRZ51374.1 hypothetical protein [Candidatus Paceibacterota bacterium]HSA37096.1 hypothetical protein [Candidatus Paceibacterota bacterium]
MNCDQACKSLGCSQGYCGTWIENEDQTFTVCAAGEFPYHASGSLVVSDCIDELGADKKSGLVCCCKTQPPPDQP